MEPQSDASDTRGDPLVARWRADPAGGFAEIVDRYGPMVHARCRRVLGDRDADADDAAQAVFLVLHRRRDRALAAPVLAAWLMATTTLVLRNAVRDRDRRRSREAPMSDLPAPDPVDGAPDPRIRDRLDACLDRLPDPERTALILHYLGGHSIAEVAARTGAGISTVTDRLRRGLARLRRALGGPDGPVGLGAVTVGMAADGALPPALAARLHALPTTPPPPGPDRWAHLETISVTRIALVASAGLVLGGGILLVLPTAEPPAPPAADPVAAAVPAGPAVYRSGTGAAMRYLVMDQGLAMVQDLNGTVIASERLQADGGDRWTGRRWGIAGTLALRREGAAVLLTDGSGTARFERVAGSLAPAVGWDAHPVAAGPAPAALRDRLVQELSRITAARSKAQAAFQAALRRRSGDTPVTALPEFTAMQDGHRQAVDWLRAAFAAGGWFPAPGDAATTRQLLDLLAAMGNEPRLLATAHAALAAEVAAGRRPERELVPVADALALARGEPLPYGTLVVREAAGSRNGTPAARQIIPVAGDAASVDAARRRVGLPPLSAFAQQSKAQVVLLDPAGRRIAEAPLLADQDLAAGLDGVALERAGRDPERAIALLAESDAALAAALTAADAGEPGALTAWIRRAGFGDRAVLSTALQRLPAARQPTDPAPAAYALRHRLAALVAGTPDREAPPRILAARVLAEGLVTRPAAPDRTDLAQAAELAPLLAGALADPEAAASPHGHLIADTLACIRFRQGRAAEAATLWERAIALAGAGAPPLYQRRLAAARRGDAPGDLPR